MIIYQQKKYFRLCGICFLSKLQLKTIWCGDMCFLPMISIVREGVVYMRIGTICLLIVISTVIFGQRFLVGKEFKQKLKRIYQII